MLKTTLILHRVPRENDCNQRDCHFSNTTSSYAITHVTHIFFTSIVKTPYSKSQYTKLRATQFQKKWKRNTCGRHYHSLDDAIFKVERPILKITMQSMTIVAHLGQLSINHRGICNWNVKSLSPRLDCRVVCLTILTQNPAGARNF